MAHQIALWFQMKWTLFFYIVLCVLELHLQI